MVLEDYLHARLGLPPLTPRARALAAAGFTLLVASLFAGPAAPGMLYAGGVLVGFTAAYVAFYSLKASAFGRVRVERVTRGPLVEGVEAEVEVRIVNPTPFGFELVEVTDSPPSVWEWRGARGLASVPPRSTVSFKYRVKPLLGKHAFGPVRLVYRDPLSLVQVERRAADGQAVAVQPRPIDVPARGLRAAVALQPGGLARTRRRGVGSEFLDLREYVPGDDIRYVDWKATARTGKLMVKVMELETVNRIVVVLDLAKSMFTGIAGETKAEYAARITVSLAEYLARRGDHYMIIVVNPERSVAHTPWLRGRHSTVQAVRFLAENIYWPGTHLERPMPARRAFVVKSTFKRVLARSKSLIIYITDFGESVVTAREYAGEVLGKLKGLGHEVIAIIPSTIAFEAQQLGPLAPLYRLLSLDRIKVYASIRSALHSHGVPTVVAGPRDALQVLLHHIDALAG